jgi:hypothetical protein
LPATTCDPGIGFSSKGSRDRCSRSPAAASIAMSMAPANDATSAKTDSMPSSTAALSLPDARSDRETISTTPGPISVNRAGDRSDLTSRA